MPVTQLDMTDNPQQSAGLVGADTHSDTDILDRWPTDRLLAANLDALRGRDQALAATIAAVPIPDSVAMVVARDGSVTYRLAGSDGRGVWLGCSSTPLISAAANLKRTELTGGNLAISTFGHGADVQALLGKMAFHQAIFVIDNDPLRLKLVLGLRDFTEALAAGRLVLVLGDDPAAALGQFLLEHEGYGVVDQTITCTWMSEQENQRFSQQATVAVADYARQSFASVNQLRNNQQRRDSNIPLSETIQHFRTDQIESLCAINVLQPASLDHCCTIGDALNGLGQMGAATDWQTMDRPDIVSNQFQLERYGRLMPQLLLLMDSLRGDVAPELPSSAICVTWLSDSADNLLTTDSHAVDRLGRHDFVCTTRAEQSQTLQHNNFPAERIVLLPPAGNTGLFRPAELTEAQRSRYGADVVLVADRASTDPKTYEIQLPSHQELLQRVSQHIHRNAAQYHYGQAEKYLEQASGSCGVQLREEDLRQYFIKMIQRYLGQTILYDTYGLALAEAQVNLRIWGQTPLSHHCCADLPGYWAQSPVASEVAGSVDYHDQLNLLFNAGKIHLHVSSRPYPDRHLMAGIAAGAFFLVKSHPGHRAADGLGKFFQLDRELITFDTPEDLLRKVRYYLAHPDERDDIARRARQKLLEHHTWKQRLTLLLETISRRLSEG